MKRNSSFSTNRERTDKSRFASLVFVPTLFEFLP